VRGWAVWHMLGQAGVACISPAHSRVSRLRAELDVPVLPMPAPPAPLLLALTGVAPCFFMSPDGLWVSHTKGTGQGQFLHVSGCSSMEGCEQGPPSETAAAPIMQGGKDGSADGTSTGQVGMGITGPSGSQHFEVVSESVLHQRYLTVLNRRVRFTTPGQPEVRSKAPLLYLLLLGAACAAAGKFLVQTRALQANASPVQVCYVLGVWAVPAVA
jgi:hypothetical protein